MKSKLAEDAERPNIRLDELLTAAQVRAMLRHRVKIAGLQRVWAAEHGVTAQHISDMLSGREVAGPKMQKALGLERVVMWRITKPKVDQ